MRFDTYLRLMSPLLSLALILTDCHKGEQAKIPDPDMALAKVGSAVVTLRDLNEQMERYKELIGSKGAQNSSSGVKLKQVLLNRLVDDKVVEIEVKKRGIEVSGAEVDEEIKSLLGKYDSARLGLALAENKIDFDTWKARLVARMKIRKLVTLEIDRNISIDKFAAEEYFKQNASAFKWPKRVRALQIMVDDEAEAERIRKRLLKQSDFSKMAKELSQSPDAAQGGDLGYFSRGQMPPEFEKVVFRLKEGQISEVVKSIYGFHIFKVIAKKKPRAMEFKEAREEIEKILLGKKREEEFKKWIKKMREGLVIEIYHELLAS